MPAFLTDRTWLWMAAALYAVEMAVGTRRLVRGGRPSRAWSYSLSLAGYVLQTAGLALRGRAVHGCPLGNAFEMVQFTAWSAMTLYLVVGVTFRSSVLGYLASALVALLSLVSLAIPAWDATRRSGIFGGNPWIEFHAALALFSYGVFGLLAVTSLMYLLRNYSLKSKHLGGMFLFLPSILDLDQINRRLLAAGVTLLTAALVVGGIYWARDPATVDAGKLLCTVAVWAAYAAALALRGKGTLLAPRFSWTCVALFAGALLSLQLVNSSRHPAVPAGTASHP